MNIKQNIVKIKTALEFGTGIMYKTEAENTYIVITNFHVIEGVVDIENNDITGYIDLDIYDKKGKKIEVFENEKIKIKLFAKKETGVDIAVIKIEFDTEVDLQLENKINFDDELDQLYLEGFPQVMSDDDISSKIEIEGKHKTIFPQNEQVGIFQITDNYNVYDNYNDLDLFRGFSGGAVYRKAENGTYIVGLNQAIPNIDNGENPFKFVYFYKMKFVLEYLKDNGCIIYSKKADESIRVKWIYNNDDKIGKNVKKEEKEISLLVIGSSGAGKSSLVKTFLHNSKHIKSTNDGQTTRTRVIYNISRYEEKPRAEVKFLNQGEFVSKMIGLNYENYLVKILQLKYENDKITILEDWLKYLCVILDGENDIIKQIKKLYTPNKENPKENLKTRDRLINHYENILNLGEKIVYNKVAIEVDLESGKEEKFLSKQALTELNTDNQIDNILKKVDGFFEESEFESDIFPKKSKDDKGDAEIEENSINEKTKDYFEEYYKHFYQKHIKPIIDTIEKEKKVIKHNKFKKATLDFKDELLTYCLQKYEGLSLTSAIESVEIYDSISNEYSFLFDELEISKIKLIDTHGLDHAEWSGNSERILSRMINELNVSGSIEVGPELGVLYVKKMDSGKPTELKNMLPSLFNIIPQAPVYCVFTGVDIPYGLEIDELKPLKYPKELHEDNNENEDKINEFEEKYNLYKKKLPKTIQYIYDAETELLSKIEGKAGFKECMYKTLKNNIITICSSSELIEKYPSVYENNIKQIYQILQSIMMKEMSSITIVPQDFIKKLKNGDYNNEIDVITKRIFEKASITNWSNYHWKTTQANKDRVTKNNNTNELGYNGTYEHQWNVLFRNGYNEAIVKFEEELFANIDKNYKLAVESAVKNMENEFLGSPNHLAHIKTDNESKFKEILKSMYDRDVEQINSDDKKIFAFNPFVEDKATTDENRVDFMNDVCDFEKGYQYIKDDLRMHFVQCLVKQIKKDNKDKAQNLVKINQDFYQKLNVFKSEVNKKYGENCANELLRVYLEKD